MIPFVADSSLLASEDHHLVLLKRDSYLTGLPCFSPAAIAILICHSRNVPQLSEEMETFQLFHLARSCLPKVGGT